MGEEGRRRKEGGGRKEEDVRCGSNIQKASLVTCLSCRIVPGMSPMRVSPPRVSMLACHQLGSSVLSTCNTSPHCGERERAREEREREGEERERERERERESVCVCGCVCNKIKHETNVCV